MPKCGSTSIQNELLSQQNLLASDRGFLFLPDNQRFGSHWNIARLVNAHTDDHGLVTTLRAQLTAARERDCDIVCISSEDLVFMLESEQKIRFFEQGLQDSGLSQSDITYVMIHRTLDDFLLSYMKQLASNGGTLVDGGFQDLCPFFVRLMRRFFRLNGERIAVSLDRAKAGAGLVRTFFAEVGLVEVDVSERFDNRWGVRPFISEILCGQIVGLYAMNNRLHPNEPNSDRFRTELRDLIDAAAPNGAVGQLFQELERRVKREVEDLLKLSLGRLTADDKDFLEWLQREHVIRVSRDKLPIYGLQGT